MSISSCTEVKVTALPPCDFCSLLELPEVPKAYYDGRTTMGPWANMCQEHFDQYGVGLGLGRGQKLVLKKDNLE